MWGSQSSKINKKKEDTRYLSHAIPEKETCTHFFFHLSFLHFTFSYCQFGFNTHVMSQASSHSILLLTFIYQFQTILLGSAKVTSKTDESELKDHKNKPIISWSNRKSTVYQMKRFWIDQNLCSNLPVTTYYNPILIKICTTFKFLYYNCSTRNIAIILLLYHIGSFHSSYYCLNSLG